MRGQAKMSLSTVLRDAPVDCVLITVRHLTPIS